MEYVQVAANFTVEDKNSELKFHFMLHADKKSRNSWKDFELPFPVITNTSKAGIESLPDNLKLLVYKED
jgi:hypothetical protein